MIASVVLAASVIGIAGTLAAAYQQDAIRGNMVTALALANQLMEEIASVPLGDGGASLPGWLGGQQDRTQYDTVDDYNGYSDTSSGLSTSDGTSVNVGGGGTYARTAVVQSNAMPTGLTGAAGDFTLVTVTVTMPRGQTVSVSQLFTKATITR